MILKRIIKGWDEQDVLTPWRNRRMPIWLRRHAADIKRRYRRRERREAKRSADE